MVLYIIGLGLSHPQDISLKGLELIKQSDLVYLESYTSRLQCPVKDLEELYGKKIILADRVMAEQGMELIITEAETKKIWVNSQVDENGDMVEGHYKHVIVTPGHWAVKDGGRK